MDSFFTFISENSPTVGLIIIVAVAVYFITMYHVSIQNTKKKVDGLPCDDHKDQIASVIRQVDSLPCDNRKEVLVDISSWIGEKDPSMVKTLMAKLSPYQLTDVGKKLLEISGGKRCVDQNLDLFMSEIRNKNPLTPYDVERQALGVLMDYRHKPMYNQIKNFLYYMPQTIEGVGDASDISIFTVEKVMSVYLRDFYLEVYPEVIPELELIET